MLPSMITATIETSAGTVTLEGDATEIGQALASLGAGPSARPSPLPVRRGPGRPPKAITAANGVVAAKRRKPVSADVASKRKLQGQYMGTLRALSAGDKKRVQAIAKENGVGEALKLAKEMVAKAAKE
jgi:hypothetical protein